MPRSFRFKRRWIAALLAAVLLLAGLAYWTGPAEPVYQGRRLSEWLKGHPREYHPAVHALGTNALPYLLAELRATDSGPARFGERMLAKVSMGPFWRTARDRRYRAGLALQILDTNAAPALVNMILASPMRMVEGDPSYSAASALKWLASREAKQHVQERLAQALRSPDVAQRRNACLAFSCWPNPNDDGAASLAVLTRDTNATVRLAAVRVLIFCVPRDDLFLPALISRLEDEQGAVRRLAVEALGHRTTNALSALPALRAAHAAELSRPNLRANLDEGYYGAAAFSVREIRGAIESAIKAIDPNAPLPAITP